MKVKCEVNGKKFTSYIKGKLNNTEKSIEISRYEDIPNMVGTVSAYPTADDYVDWTDVQGVSHRSLFFKDRPFAVDKEFITTD